MQSTSAFLDMANFTDLNTEEILMFAELKGVSRDSHIYIYILDLLQVRYNCAKSHHCRICATDFREGVLYAPLLHP